MVAAAPLSARCSMAAPSFRHRAAPSPRSMAPPLLPPSRRSMTAPPPPAVAPVHGGRPSLTFSSRSCRLPFPRRSPAPPQTCLPPPAWSAAASFQQIVGIGHCVTLEGSGRGSRTRSGCRMPLPTSTAAGGGHRGEGAWQKQASRCHPGCSASAPPARSISAVQRRPRGWTCLPSAVGGCTVAVACHIGLGVLDHQQRAHGCCTRKERLEKEFHTRAAAAGGCHVRIMMGRCNYSSGRIDSPSEPTNPVAKETKSKKHGMSVKCNISRSLFLLSAAVAGTSHKSGHVRVLRCSFISLPSTYLFNIPNGCTNNQPSWSVWDTNPKCVSVKQRLARNGEVENCCSWYCSVGLVILDIADL